MRSAELVGVAQPIACCGEIGGIRRRGLIGECRMGALMIVIGDRKVSDFVGSLPTPR